MFLNANADSNEVWMLKRANNGQLTVAGTFSTQGAGSGLTELASQGEYRTDRRAQVSLCGQRGQQ